jgi:hypothetical protein
MRARPGASVRQIIRPPHRAIPAAITTPWCAILRRSQDFFGAVHGVLAVARTGTGAMTIDEELTKLEDNIRRLKIDYDIYFNGGAKRPPTDAQWRVEAMLKRLQDSTSMNFGQRFRYTSLTQRYGLFAELWRQRVKTREEGPRRTVAEVRAERKTPTSFRVDWKDPAKETEKVEQLFAAFIEAKRKCGEAVENVGSDAFKRFVKQKTEQLKRDFKCEQVEYVVEVEQGQVKLKAKGI